MNMEESWLNFLKHSFQLDLLGEIPQLFRKPYCGTCSHWFLINKEGLHHLAVTSSPKEYEEILNDIDGKRHGIIRERDEVDVYTFFRFYGWCKRFPPMHRQSYSIIKFRTIFSLLNNSIPKKVSEYDFPLMPHESVCGEWREAKWVDDFVTENKLRTKSPT